MAKNHNKTPALLTGNDDAYQNLQGRKWIALAEGNKAEADKIQKQIDKLNGNKGGLLARLMSGGQ